MPRQVDTRRYGSSIDVNIQSLMTHTCTQASRQAYRQTEVKRRRNPIRHVCPHRYNWRMCAWGAQRQQDTPIHSVTNQTLNLIKVTVLEKGPHMTVIAIKYFYGFAWKQRSSRPGPRVFADKEGGFSRYKKMSTKPHLLLSIHGSSIEN